MTPTNKSQVSFGSVAAFLVLALLLAAVIFVSSNVQNGGVQAQERVDTSLIAAVTDKLPDQAGSIEQTLNPIPTLDLPGYQEFRAQQGVTEENQADVPQALPISIGIGPDGFYSHMRVEYPDGTVMAEYDWDCTEVRGINDYQGGIDEVASWFAVPEEARAQTVKECQQAQAGR